LVSREDAKTQRERGGRGKGREPLPGARASGPHDFCPGDCRGRSRRYELGFVSHAKSRRCGKRAGYRESGANADLDGVAGLRADRDGYVDCAASDELTRNQNVHLVQSGKVSLRSGIGDQGLHSADERSDG